MAKKGSLHIFNQSPVLIDIFLDKPLSETIHEIVKKHECDKNGSKQLDLPSDSYSLKIIENKGGYCLNYLTEENKFSLEDGFAMKLDYSISCMIEKIFKKMGKDRSGSFSLLYNLGTDPTFIRELVNRKLHLQVLKMVHQQNLEGTEAAACFVVILHLLKLGLMEAIDYDPLLFILNFPGSESNLDQAHLAMAVLCQILYQKSSKFKQAKEKILNSLGVSDMLTRIKHASANKDFVATTLQLINAMVKIVQGDMKLQLTKEMNLRVNKEIIYNYVVLKGMVDHAIGRELHIYQSNILSLHANALHTYMDPMTNELAKDEFELEDFQPRSSILFEFENSSIVKRSNSQDTILSTDENRISFASIKSIATSKSLESYCSIDESDEDKNISYLAYECLVHYKNYYFKNFCQSKCEENTYEPGIFPVSETITKILASILRIGKEPDKHSDCFQPLVFNPKFKQNFFQELFCRTMWLLSKTRREMKATVYDDFERVVKILRKQIEMVLKTKPKDYNELIEKMKNISYTAVSDELEEEYNRDLEKLLKTHPSVQEIKIDFIQKNRELIFLQRTKAMQKGNAFPKLPLEKKRIQYFYVNLSKNLRTIYWSDWDDELKKYIGGKENGEMESFNISDIRHFVIGKACPHVKDGTVKKYTQAFTVILDNNETINFYAADEKTAENWVDGFNLLLGKDYRTAKYKDELETLVEMDCVLQLVELQNIKIPSKAPIIPQLPKEVKPPIPKRDPLLQEKLRQKQKALKEKRKEKTKSDVVNGS